jgi:small subunit ribosomal protein S18
MLRKKSRYLEGVKDIDIRDVEFLRKFMTDHGKIMPSRMTGANAKQQRLIRQGIRRARQMGLLA